MPLIVCVELLLTSGNEQTMMSGPTVWQGFGEHEYPGAHVLGVVHAA
jgi:hypothetical protein